MKLTVRTLCEMTDPKMTPVVGHDRLDNEVRWVVSTEHLTPNLWLRGGEFMLMCGWNFRSSKVEMENYVEHLARNGLAGLGFAIGIKYDEVPAPIIKMAAKLGFPVCKVPYELGFMQISEKATAFLYEQKRAQLSIDDLFHSEFIDAVLDGEMEIQDLAVQISSMLLCSVRIRDGLGDVLAGSKQARRLSDADSQTPKIISISVTNQYTLELQWDEADLTATRQTFLNEVVLAAKICLRQKDARDRERLRLESDTIHDIAWRKLDEAQITSRLSAFGIDPVQRQTAIVIRDPVYPSRISKQALQVFRHKGARYITSWKEYSLEAVIETPSARLLQELIAATAEELPTATIGVGNTVEIPHLANSIIQARYLARSKARGVYRHGMLGADELLMLVEQRAASDYIAKVIGKDLPEESIAIIEALLDCGFNINLCAAQLGIHRHTLRYKIENFIETTGLDIRQPQERFQAWLAIRLLRNSQRLGQAD